MSSKKIIAIIGLMGVGKTTIGAKLAEKTKRYFLDCDAEIEDFENRNIKEIFAESGEKYFREIEKKIIREIVLRDEEIVLSLGGGAFIDVDTRKLLKEKAVIIWLHASVETILHRVGNKNTRPLLNQKNKREILEELVAKRYPIYAEADLKFDTSDINHDTLINKIIREIKLLENEK
ncbi:MAG: shikimate kinase [Rickettsiales bacterium]|nr:shikimate kinase [Rickettsiales bacterium]